MSGLQTVTKLAVHRHIHDTSHVKVTNSPYPRAALKKTIHREIKISKNRVIAVDFIWGNSSADAGQHCQPLALLSLMNILVPGTFNTFFEDALPFPV